jgi:hypothetical protein
MMTDEYTGMVDDINYCADLDEQLGYDADHSDERQYCRHGKWIGSWWGPDYLCGSCEDGLSVEAAEYIEARNDERRAREALKTAMQWYDFGRFVWVAADDWGLQGKSGGAIDAIRHARLKFMQQVMENLVIAWPEIKRARARLSRRVSDRVKLETPEVLAELERAYG